ncbi:MAG: TIGR02186 family protein [Alphaproteobacteria bacterium]|nr:TIGR02186 family protein [Alphaproteobacteria bacterium]
MRKSPLLILCALIFVLILGTHSHLACANNQSRIVIDMAQESVDVTTGFSGSNIVVFGTIEKQGREIKSPGVAIILKGPNSRVIVREKKAVAGMWLNSDSIEFKNIPHFYDYAVNMKESDMTSAQVLIDNGIGLNALVFEPDDSDDLEDGTRFRKFQESLIRIWQRDGNLSLGGRSIKFIGNGLFRADFSLPASIPTGTYQVEAFLFEEGKLIDKREKILEVKQAGMSAVINHYAHAYSLVYALVGFLMAIGIGILSANLSRKGR